MPGEARTSEFLLSTATLMIGPRASVMELVPAKHSLGLIKNVQVSQEMGYTELTQGVNNAVVASVNTSAVPRISGEVYEYSARNLAYGAGLDGSDTAYDPIVTQTTLSANLTVTSGNKGSLVLATGGAVAAGFAAGEYGVLQDLNAPDKVHVFKVASVATDTLTLATGYELPVGETFNAATSVVYRVKAIKVGQVPKQPTFGAKLVGLLPETGEPVTIIFPKVKITKGLGAAFQTDNFSNMPFEFTPYPILSGDPYYSDFGSLKSWKILRR